MLNSIIAIITLILIVITFGWCIFNGFRKKYVHKETGVVFILKDVEETCIDDTYTETVTIYTLQSTETGKVIHITKEVLNDNFKLVI